MEKQRFIVVGGVAAGMSAASRVRRLKPDSEILVFERSGYVSYIACGMPYLISDKVKSADSLIVYDAKYFKEQRNIDVFLHNEVRQIVPQRKSVMVRDLQTGEEREYAYDKLLIATGARPVIPQIKGRDLKGIFSLRRLEDGIAIKNYIKENSPKTGLILGAGSIGMEMAESFSESGIKVTIVEKMSNILGTMDDEINELVEPELKGKGINLIKSRSVREFAGEDYLVRKAILDSGETLETDIAIIGAGIRPDSGIAQDAGLELGVAGAIKVNERMETNIPDIYAAGDCAEAYHLVYGRNVYFPLGTTANKQGRVAGENMAGGQASFAGILGTAVFKLFDLEVGRTGLSEKEVRIEGIDYISNTIDSISRSRYYPGAGRIRIKLVAERNTGRLLGAQIAGYDTAAKRLDVLAAAITARMTAREVENLDLGYSPPLAPVFDPVIIAAAELEKKIKGQSVAKKAEPQKDGLLSK
jgi:NADPH-dependent 2,4-dienoyl-CoA reductase/sulfur reductase-like enzyme